MTTELKPDASQDEGKAKETPPEGAAKKNEFEEELTDEEKAAEAAALESKKEEEKAAAIKAKAGDKEGEKSLTPAEELALAEKQAREAIEAERAELRQAAREQKREVDRLNIELEKATKALQKAELLPEDDPEIAKKTEELAAIRQSQLETLLETMELNPKFEDVREVVSQSNFDDIVEAMAKHVVSTEGGKLMERVKEVEIAVWRLPNPYKYMYQKIKEFHPAFAKPAGEGKKKEDDEKGKEKPPDSPPPKVPGSVHNIPGGGSAATGWTAAMIDDLPEDELHKVPRDVYDKYLKNQLK
jgi:hypothetical protein